MKKIVGLVLVAIIGITYAFTPATSEETGIEFQSITVKEAMTKAKKTGKLIFIDCYTNWCGPCKRMAATSFKDAEVAKVYNDQFINVKVEMEKDAEGPDLARKYSVRAYPTLLVIDGNGKIVKQVIGGQDVAGLLMLAETVKK